MFKATQDILDLRNKTCKNGNVSEGELKNNTAFSRRMKKKKSQNGLGLPLTYLNSGNTPICPFGSFAHC